MYKKIRLDNGIRVVCEAIPYAHSVVLGVWVRAGSRDETDKNHGVSHFLEHLLFKGTDRRTAKQIAEELEAVGGVLNAFTTKEYSCFYSRVLAEHLDLAIDILSDMFFNSLLAANDIEREKNVILEEIKMYEDSPDELIHDLFARIVWPGHPLGRAILGTCTSVAGLEREAILDYYQKQYNASNLVLAVAGKVNEEEVLEKLAVAFGQKPLQGQNIKHGPPSERAAVNNINKDTEQIQICIGTPGLAQEDPQVYTMQLLNNILGGGISSRLFQDIREDKGLAYAIYSYYTAYSDSGLFTVYAGTSPVNCHEVIASILNQIKLLKKNGVSESELQRTKDQIRGNLLLSMENVSQRMSRLGKTELCFDRVITTEEIVANIKQVTAEDVKRLAEQIFKRESFSLATLGPQKEELDFGVLLAEGGV
jgi:predicted Zn-dependent peptidase